MNEYSKKMLKVPTYNLLREQDMGKLPVLDVRNLGIDRCGRLQHYHRTYRDFRPHRP